jgi:hypothetical protein
MSAKREKRRLHNRFIMRTTALRQEPPFHNRPFCELNDGDGIAGYYESLTVGQLIRKDEFYY